MHKILILILIMLPLRLLATEIEIVADVNGEPISNLDIERRINFINSLLGTQKINQKEVKISNSKTVNRRNYHCQRSTEDEYRIE